MTPEQLRTIDAMVAEYIMGWEWRQWPDDNISYSIAWYERLHNVHFLRDPHEHWDTSIVADGTGLRRGTEEYKRLVIRDFLKHEYGVGVAWHAMLPPSYTTDGGAILEVAEAVRKRFGATAVRLLSCTIGWEATTAFVMVPSVRAQADTAPIAMCLCALKAVNAPLPELVTA